MNTEQERAEFEAFASKHGLCVTEDGDLYRSHDVDWLWKAWQARAALQSQDREDAEVTAYALPNGTTVERTMQRDGSFLWAVRDGLKKCLSKSGEWDYEPFPSSRTEEWLDQHRFSTAQEAIDHARRVEDANDA